MLITLEEEGYLAPRVWGALLVVAIIGLVIWGQYRLKPDMDPPPAPVQAAPVAPRPVSSPADFVPLAGVGEIVPSNLDTTSVTLQLPALTPLPTPAPLALLHTIKAGETLISIAAKYNITTEALLAANDIRDPTALKNGQQLLIPPPEGLKVPVVLHQVKAEDNLISIASLYGSSLKDIAEANPAIDPERPPVGQALIVPIVFNQPKPGSRPVSADGPVYYTVQPGDIPLGIAAQFDVPAEVLLATNGITDATRLQIGQELVIPPYEGESISFPVVLHELEEGDTLLELATRYGSSVKDILAVNPELVPSSLEPGQIVAVPIIFGVPRPEPEPGDSGGPAPAPVEPSAPLVDLQQQMVAAINIERANNSLSPYQLDPQLTQVAVAHAQDMVKRDFFSHFTPEGKSVRDRIVDGGITDALNVGENIQLNTRPRDSTVQSALTWFMGSPPHRHNLLHPAHNRVGVGIVEGPPGWYTFVLVFAER